MPDDVNVDERRHLGRAIREARHRRGATLAEIATVAEVSVSLLSQVERGLADPSLDSLRAISRALGTTPFRLLSDRTNRCVVVRRDAGRKIALDDRGGWSELLTTWDGSAFEVSRWSIEPGAATQREPRGHAGEEAMFVLSGSAAIEVGDETYSVGEGDIVVYDARLPHRITAQPDGRLIALFVTCPPY